MTEPYSWTDEDEGPLQRRMDTLMMHAVLTGELGPLIELVDLQIAGGTTDRTRTQVLAQQWFTSSLREDRLSDGVHLRFACQLIDGGWCRPLDLDIATAENLYLLGVRCGTLTARIWDFVAEYHHLGRYAEHSLRHIHREKNANHIR